MQRPVPAEPPLPHIRPLPRRTASLLRSSIVIPSLPSILAELVHNALDARATQVHLTVDLDTWSIKCDDNGSGISPEGLATLEHEGRYSTSKLPGSDGQPARHAYGFRGEALASLAEVGLLEVRTRTAHGETHELVLRGGATLSRGVSSIKRTGQGTTVWVRDIFYKWPVRRRPLSTPSAQLSLLSSFRSALATLSLVHPSVSFSLADTTRSPASASREPKRLLAVPQSTEGTLGRWRQLWGRAGAEKVWQINEEEDWGEAGTIRAEGFFSLTASHSKASQFICACPPLRPSLLKSSLNALRIVVNSRPLSPSSLHKLLNALFASSSFARHAASHLSLPGSSTSAPTTPSGRSRTSPKKAVERHPIFCLSLTVPSGCVDVSLEPEKRVVEFEDQDRINAFLTRFTKRYLVSQGFLHIVPASPLETAPAPEVLPQSQSQTSARRRPLDPHRVGSTPLRATKGLESLTEAESGVCGSSRIGAEGVGTAGSKRRKVEAAKEVVVFPHATPSGSFLPRSTTLLTTPSRPSSAPAAAQSNDPASATSLRWTDPTTLQTFLVDPRTGNSRLESVNPADGVGGGARGNCGGGRGQWGRVDRSSLLKAKNKAGGDGDDQAGEGGKDENSTMPVWLDRTFKTWSNPVFPSSANSSIPTLPTAAATLSSIFSSSKPSLSSSRACAKSSSAGPLTHSRLATISAFFSSSAAAKTPTELVTPGTRAGAQKFDKASLRRAEFIAQVDCKFLLVKLPPASVGGNSTLVLFDQHAASERVRVEKFLERLCGRVARGEDVEVLYLTEVGEGEQATRSQYGVVVSREEALELPSRLENFRRWGIGIALNPSSSHSTSAAAAENDYAQVWLTTVPEVVSARLLAEPKTLQELVRSYLAQLRETGYRARPGKEQEAKATREGSSWTTAVKDCPHVLLDLVNSKACRGAIMFNDELSAEQAQALVARLADTTFPFQCAHGRPSLVPLINLPAPPAPPSPSSSSVPSEVDWARFSS
ncbi:hypothetical protein JCM21900_004855 [Sporobolomyces salmonicolor]